MLRHHIQVSHALTIFILINATRSCEVERHRGRQHRACHQTVETHHQLAAICRRRLQVDIGDPALPQEVGSIHDRRGQKSLMLHLKRTFALRYRQRIHPLVRRTHHETYSYQPKRNRTPKSCEQKPNSAHPPLIYNHSKTRVTHPRPGRSIRTVPNHASSAPRLNDTFVFKKHEARNAEQLNTE